LLPAPINPLRIDIGPYFYTYTFMKEETGRLKADMAVLTVRCDRVH